MSTPSPPALLRLRLYAGNLPRQRLRLRSVPPSAFCVVTAADGTKLGQTEVVVHNINPQWTECIYMEDHNQQFHVHVFHHNLPHQTCDTTAPVSSDRYFFTNDASTSLGSAFLDAQDILHTLHKTRVKRLRLGGCIYCQMEIIDDCRSTAQVTLQVAVHELIGPKRRRIRPTRIEVSKPSQSHQGGWLVVARSDVVENVQDVFYYPSVDWKDHGVLLLDDPLRITVVGGSSQQKPKGMAETTLRHLLRLGSLAMTRASRSSKPMIVSKTSSWGTTSSSVVEDDEDESDEETALVNSSLRPNELYLQRSLTKAKRVGKLRVLLAQVVDSEPPVAHIVVDNPEVVDLAQLQPVVQQTKTFADYVKQGCELDFCVAIDFTSSNGDPRSEQSLHHQIKDSYNDYEETIVALGQAIDNYNSSKQHLIWGFGAKFGGTVRHLFQCGAHTPVQGVDGILNAYKSMFQSDLIMSGPTILTQVIQAAAIQARTNHNRMTESNMRFTVLLIITDGLADEFEETQRKLTVYSDYPLSVVIVGVGNSDFGSMHALGSLANTSFVEFREHQHNPTALGEVALRNIPEQLCQYMRRRGF